MNLRAGCGTVKAMTGRKPFQIPTLGPVYVPPGGPPQGPGPSKEICPRMGEESIYRMCADFYAELERSPIRPLFSPDMPAASRKLAAFLIQICGGPPRYSEQYGDPMMRARHLAIPINEEARQIWLGAFGKVLAGADRKYGFPAEHLPGFKAFLESFSGWMVNRR